MNKKYIKLARKVRGYQKGLQKYGPEARALQWRSKEAAELRYEQLIADIDFEGKSVLDVGCGFGDIIPFISSKSRKFKYTGVDIVPEFIRVAKKRYSGNQFLIRDYFGDPLEGVFDIIVSSGTLNVNLQNALLYRKKAIKAMFEHANEIIGFNMAGGYPQPENKKINRVYFADSLKILEYCLGLTNKLIFRHHYRKKDFTMVMFK